MKLKSYLAENNITMKKFAEMMDVTPHTISYVSKGQIPGRKLGKKIEAFTGGIIKFEHKPRRPYGSVQRTLSEQDHSYLKQLAEKLREDIKKELVAALLGDKMEDKKENEQKQQQQ